MKKWMALLLCCLLCLCAAGAMAEEPVTLNIYENICYDIYPNGYISSENPGVLVPHTGSYIFTGVSVGQSDNPLNFYANAYGKEPGNNQNVSYDVTFKALQIAVDPDCTAIRFFADDVDANVENCKITINLSSINDGVGNPHFVHASSCPAFNNNQPENNNTVEILVHNVSGTLEFGRDGSHNENIVSRGVTLTYDDEDGQKVTIDGNVENDPNNDENLWIRTSSCPYHLTYQPTTATCTAAGKQGYYTCTICKRIYLNENATGETTLADLPAAGPLGHELTHVDGKPATCTEDGNIEYYRCTREGCGELFADADGKNETTLSAVTLPAQHVLTKVEAKAPTCTEDGNIEHWVCTRCGELFADADGKNETTLSAVTLPAQHALTLVPRKEPTYEQDGNIEHYRCTGDGCGKLFADADGKQELTPEEVILPMLTAYRITYGDGASIIAEQNTTLRFIANGPLAKLTAVLVDGRTLDAKQYTAESGSTIITLAADYLKTLAVGEHTLTVRYTDGETSARFTVTAMRQDLPQTGDSSHLTGWLALLGACGAGLWCVSRRRG